ncbi:MAG TPA: hypothetical protein VN754_00330, partial [Candidatus Binataceae bacterium]|nr:hypothetical protein [Candidatus Binataceae bacterium]
NIGACFSLSISCLVCQETSLLHRVAFSDSIIIFRPAVNTLTYRLIARVEALHPAQASGQVLWYGACDDVSKKVPAGHRPGRKEADLAEFFKELRVSRRGA